MSNRFRFRGGLLLLAVLVVFGAACGGSDRPTVQEWQPTWDGFTAIFPTAAELGDPTDRELCSRALGELRSSQDGLFPAPNPAIDSAVEDWVRVAEDALFECPPTSEDTPDMASAYAELARLEAEVSAVLDIDAGG